jgi:hypothetical protein
MHAFTIPLVTCFNCLLLVVGASAAPLLLSDGKTFAGWIGDTNQTWRIEAEAFVGGSLKRQVPRNEFLRTIRSYTNFVLRLQFKLEGTNGFVNAGVQVRSQPASNPPNEMVGYQADLGDGYWGALYDESRRNKVLAQPNAGTVKRAFKPGDWNDYEIRCEGKRLRTFINRQPMADYTEPDAAIPQFGVIGLQIHGGGPAQASYRAITIEELP